LTTPFDPNSFDPKMFAMFQQFMAMVQANGGEMPSFAPTAPQVVPQVPCPKISDITLAQFTLIDNGPKGVRKKYEPRYKMCTEVWTDDAADIRLSEWAWKRNVVLIEGTVFKKRIDALLKRGSITEAFHAHLADMWTKFDTLETYFGILGDKGSKEEGAKKGTNYYDGQFMVVQVQDNVPVNMFFMIVDGETYDGLYIDKFARTDMKDQPLRGKYKFQARIDRCEFSDLWPTQEGRGEF
jgi:hypothetical protein